MPTFKTPLVGSYDQRSFSQPARKDQLFRGALLSPIINKQSNTGSYFVEKRSGLVALATNITGGTIKTPYVVYGAIGTAHVNSIWSVDSVFRLYDTDSNGTTVSCGIITTSADKFFFSETILNNITYILITAESSLGLTGEGWYLPSDAISNTAYTGDGNNSITITDLKVAGVASVAGLYVGQKFTAASNIVAGSRIASINAGAFSLTLDTATTGGAFNDLAITKEPIAKIIDPDFPTNIVGGFAEMDGFITVMTADARVYNSDINTVSAWTSGNYFPCNKYSDGGIGVFKYGDHFLAFGRGSAEFLYNPGNPSGSPFSGSDQLAKSLKDKAPTAGFAVSMINGVPWWVGSDGNIHTFEGFTEKTISALGVDIGRKPSGFLVGPTVSSIAYNKQTFFVINNTSVGGDIWYCLETGSWHDPAFNPSGTGNATWLYATSVAGIPYFACTDDNTGNIYTLRDTHNYGSTFTFQDNGAAFTLSIQIQTDMGTNDRKWPSELRVNADTQSSGNLAVSYSDDDGATFSTARNIPLNSQRKRLNRLGSFCGRRLWKFEDSGNNANRIASIEVDYDLGSQ